MRILALNKTHFVKELRLRGHEVVVACRPEEQSRNRTDTWSLTGWEATYERGEQLSALLSRLPNGFVPDRIVYFDESSMFFALRGLEDAPCPIVFYSVDAHVHYSWHPQMAGVFDAVFVAQMDHIARFEKYNSHVEWLPLWAPIISSPASTKVIEVCFRGTLTGDSRRRRAEFVTALAKEVPLDFGTGYFLEDYRRSKIVLNEAVGGDVNFRVFEALGTGALLLTQRVGNGLLELFEDGKELVTYEPYDVADAARKIRHLLSHDEERERIAVAGHERVIREHSAAARAAQFEKLLTETQKGERRFSGFAVAYKEILELSRSKEILAGDQQRVCASIALKAIELHARSGLSVDPDFPVLLRFLCKQLRDLNLAADIPRAVRACTAGWPKEFSLGLIAFHELELIGAVSEARQIAAAMGVADTVLRAHAPKLLSELERDSFFEKI